jgi:AraC-like DNA-binding protein
MQKGGREKGRSTYTRDLTKREWTLRGIICINPTNMIRNIPYNVALSGNAGRVRCEPGWSLDAAWARELVDFDLWLVWAGRGKMRLRRGEIDLVPGTCVWMRPGGSYIARQDSVDRLGVSFCHFLYKGQARNDPARNDPTYKGQAGNDPVGVGDDPPFEVTMTRSLALAQSMMAEIVRWKTELPDVSARLLGTLLEVLTLDYRADGGGGSTGYSSTQSRNRARIEAMAAEIAEEPGRPWTVAGLSAAMGYAPDHFSRLFKAVTGERPQSYVLNRRIARARQLLRETTLSVGEIAHVLGFQDPFYFSRQFRAFTGAPPTVFRRGSGENLHFWGESSA